MQTKEKLEDTTEQFISIQNDLLSGEEQIGCDTNGEDCSRILFLSQGGFDFEIYYEILKFKVYTVVKM